MKYCSNCHIITEEDKCQICGNENLNEVENGDYCFLAEKEEMWAKMFMEILKDNNIPHTSMPVLGAGLTIKTGAVERLKIYVPFENLEEAEDLLNIAFAEQ